MNNNEVALIVIVSIVSGVSVGMSLMFQNQITELEAEIVQLELMMESCQKAVETCVEIYNEVKP